MSTIIQLQYWLVIKKLPGENQVPRRCCSRPRHFCVGVDIPVNYYWAIIFFDAENHLIAIISIKNFKVAFC